MARIFRSAGYQPETAKTLDQARMLCEAEQFDLVISDVSLPDGSGINLLSQIAGVSPARGILVSGHADESYKDLGSRAGWSAYLVKPIEFESLISTVEHVLALTPRAEPLLHVDSFSAPMDHRRRSSPKTPS